MSCVQVATFSRKGRKRQWQSRSLPIIESLTPYHVTDCQKYPINAEFGMARGEDVPTSASRTRHPRGESCLDLRCGRYWREWPEKPIVPKESARWGSVGP